MVYKRHTPQKNNYNTHDKSAISSINNIPLPNEADFDNSRNDNDGHIIPGRSFSLYSLFQQIHIEELILIGLIFILLEEGIKDELLLIVLVYILITGRD